MTEPQSFPFFATPNQILLADCSDSAVHLRQGFQSGGEALTLPVDPKSYVPFDANTSKRGRTATPRGIVSDHLFQKVRIRSTILVAHNNELGPKCPERLCQNRKLLLS